MVLRSGYLALATKLQEVATVMSQSDISRRLADALLDATRSTDRWAYLIDVFGDDQSGDVVFSLDGDIKKAGYTCSDAGAVIDMEGAKDVLPITTYVDEPADGMTEAGARNSKGDKKMLQAIHDHSASLGADCVAKEAAKEIAITGDIIPLKEGAVGQDGSAFLKIIAPGRGSSGYYPAAVLERDGPTVFPKGTKNFWNHQTDAEEAARPEGDLRDLASILTEDAHYESDGPAGPGLYARAKVFENFRQPVDDLAKHIGMSIRASGTAKEGTAPDGIKGPIIEKLTRGISVDYVTTPGAGGKILQLFEAARGSQPLAENPKGGDVDMTEAEVKALQETVQRLESDNRKFKERAAVVDAAVVVDGYFSTVRVGEAIQTRVKARVLAGAVPMTESGDLDKAKLTALVEAETKDEVAYIAQVSGGRIVTNMGSAAPAQLSESEQKTLTESNQAISEEFARTMGASSPMASKIMREGRGAFDPTYNSGDKGGKLVTGTRQEVA